MKLLADECYPRRIIQALRAAGHDVRDIATTDHRATDVEVVGIAVADDRILMTADYDFAEMTIRDRTPLPGLIILAPSRETIAERALRIVEVLTASDDQFRGRLTVVNQIRVRFRPLE